MTAEQKHRLTHTLSPRISSAGNIIRIRGIKDQTQEGLRIHRIGDGSTVNVKPSAKITTVNAGAKQANSKRSAQFVVWCGI